MSKRFLCRGVFLKLVKPSTQPGKSYYQLKKMIAGTKDRGLSDERCRGTDREGGGGEVRGHQLF